MPQSLGWLLFHLALLPVFALGGWSFVRLIRANLPNRFLSSPQALLERLSASSPHKKPLVANRDPTMECPILECQWYGCDGTCTATPAQRATIAAMVGKTH